MNNDVKDPSSGNDPKSKALLLFAMIAVVAAFTAFSANAAMYFPMIVSAAAIAFTADVLKSPLFVLVAAVAAFGTSYLVARDLSVAVQNALTPLIIGTFCVLCRRKKLGLYKSSLVLGGAVFALSASFLAIYILRVYGSLIDGAKTAFSGVYENTVAQIKNYLSAAGEAGVTVAENEIRELTSLTATLLPGLAAAALQLSGVAVYLITKLYYRLFGQKTAGVKGEYGIPESAVIFFAFSVLLSLVFSLFKGLKVAHLTALNLCITLAVPTLLDGGRRIVSRFRNPPKAALPDGTVVSRPPIFLIALLALSLFLSVVGPIVILAVYSVTGTVRDIAARSSEKKED